MILLVGALLLPLAIAAQEVALPKGRIAGVVLDGASGRAIAGARITVDGTTTSTASDLEGRYRTPEVPVGPSTVRVSAIGYQKAAVTGVMVKAGQAVTANVTLTPAVVELEELSVEAVTTASSASEAGLLALQKESPTVIDGVSAEEIAKSADRDASSGGGAHSWRVGGAGPAAVAEGSASGTAPRHSTGRSCPALTPRRRWLLLTSSPPSCWTR